MDQLSLICRKLFLYVAFTCMVLTIPCTSFADRKDYANGSMEKHAGRISFSSYTNGNWQIWSIEPDGRNLVRLTHMPKDLHYPAWSPDARKIAFADNEREIWWMSPGGNPQKLDKLPPNCNHPAWIPGGYKIGCVCYTFDNRKEDSDIWVVDLITNNARKLMVQDNIQSFPSWSPDGQKMAYTTGYRVTSRKIIETLWVANADGTHPRPIINDEFHNIQPSWSPDGNEIAFASNRSGSMDIWVVDPDGQNAKQLTFDDSYDVDPSWSPDGTRLCFTSTRSGRMEIWVMDIDGENLRQLTGLKGETGESMQPSWQN